MSFGAEIGVHRGEGAISAAAVTLPLLISENEFDWGPPPAWVRYFVELGFLWPDDGTRRIGVVSTPCDSAAAGLIALGALVRRLGEPEANDLGSHKRRIRDLRPGHKGTLRRNGDRRHYVVQRRDPDGSIWLEDTSKGVRLKFLDYHASDWYFDGEAPIEVKPGDELPWFALYKALLPHEPRILEPNLRFSDSSIVLAGRSAGRTAQAEVLGELWFQVAESRSSLLTLLSLQDHQPPRTVSRIRYLNPRASAGRVFDRQGGHPRTVIADGGDSLRFAIKFDPCSDATIIAHIPRTDDQSRLEEVGEELAGLRQWFETDTELLDRLPAPPRGVMLAALRPRDQA